MNGLIWIAAFLSVPALAIVREVITPHYGWQDDDGFHYGREPSALIDSDQHHGERI